MVAWQAISITACNLLQTSAHSHPAPLSTKGLLLSLQPSVARNADEPWPDILLNMPSEQRAFFKCLPCQNSRWAGHGSRFPRGGQLQHSGREHRFLHLGIRRLSSATHRFCGLGKVTHLFCLSFFIDVTSTSTVLSLAIPQEVWGSNVVSEICLYLYPLKNYLKGKWDYIPRQVGLEYIEENTIIS